MCILQPVRRHVLRIQESLWIAGEQSLWRFGSLPWRLIKVIGWGLGVLSSRGIRWRHSLLSSISASLTRCIVVTATGTGLPNPCLRQATGSITFLYLPFSFVKSLLACLLSLTSLFEDFHFVLVFGFVLSSYSNLFYLVVVSLRAFIVLITWLWPV